MYQRIAKQWLSLNCILLWMTKHDHTDGEYICIWDKAVRRKCKHKLKVYFYHDLKVMTPDSFNSFTVTVTPQSVLWKYIIPLNALRRDS